MEEEAISDYEIDQEEIRKAEELYAFFEKTTTESNLVQQQTSKVEKVVIDDPDTDIYTLVEFKPVETITKFITSIDNKNYYLKISFQAGHAYLKDDLLCFTGSHSYVYVNYVDEESTPYYLGSTLKVTARYNNYISLDNIVFHNGLYLTGQHLAIYKIENNCTVKLYESPHITVLATGKNLNEFSSLPISTSLFTHWQKGAEPIFRTITVEEKRNKYKNLIENTLTTFFDDNWCWDSHTSHAVIIHFPEFVTTNSERKSIITRDLYLKLKFVTDLSLLESISGRVNTFTEAQLAAHYSWSHMKKDGQYSWTNFCTGEGNTEISQVIGALMSDSLTEITLTKFFLTFLAYIQWESLEGGPYTQMSTVHSYEGINGQTSLNLEKDHWANISTVLLDFLAEYLAKIKIEPMELTISPTSSQAFSVKPNKFFYNKLVKFFYQKSEILIQKGFTDIFGAIPPGALDNSLLLGVFSSNDTSTTTRNSRDRKQWIDREFRHFHYKGQKISSIKIHTNDLSDSQGELNLSFTPYFISRVLEPVLTQLLTTKFYEYSNKRNS